MDPQNQEAILTAVRQHGRESLLVLLGSPSPESSAVAAETVVSGDPAYAGPLAGVQLDLPVFHILEDGVREAIPPALYEEQVGLMGAVLDTPAIAASVEAVRSRRGSASAGRH